MGLTTKITLLITNRPLSNLPQIQAENANAVELVDGGIGAVFGVIDLRVHPGSFVVGVVNLLGFPLALRAHKGSVE